MKKKIDNMLNFLSHLFGKEIYLKVFHYLSNTIVDYYRKTKTFIYNNFWYDDAGRPPYLLYFLLLIVCFLIFCYTNIHFVKDMSLGVFSSLTAALILDYSKYKSGSIVRRKTIDVLLRRFKYTTRLLVIYISKVAINKDVNQTCYKLVEDFSFSKYDDKNFRVIKDISLVLLDFVEEAIALITIERGLLENKHVDQLLNIKNSYEKHLKHHKDNICKISESLSNEIGFDVLNGKFNSPIYKQILSGLECFFRENLEILEAGGLLKDIGLSTIEEIKEKVET